MTSIFLGLDIGGTHTRAVLVDGRGRVVGRGDASSAHHHNVGADNARARLRAAAAQAWTAAGQSMRPAAHAFLGSGGIKSEGDRATVRALAAAAGLAPAGRITVENDLANALAGGLSGRPGLALIAGTGANCLGRDPAGKTFMCGGWGWLLGDEGSACGLAMAALRTAARAADGRTGAAALLAAALVFFEVGEPDELSARFYTRAWTPGEVAAFAPVVTRLAAGGDPASLHLLAEGARALAELVAGGRRALGFTDPPEVVLLGGCVRNDALYRGIVEREILAAGPDLRLTEPEGTPLLGAAWNALRAGGADAGVTVQTGAFTL